MLLASPDSSGDDDMVDEVQPSSTSDGTPAGPSRKKLCQSSLTSFFSESQG